MKSVALLSILALAGAGVPSAATAAGAETKHETKQEMKKAAMSKLMGMVESVDAPTSKLTVKDKKGVMKDLTLGPDVKITRGGKKAALSEVMAGDAVTVQLSGEQVLRVAAKAGKKPKS